MPKYYEKPELDIVKFNTEDLVATSGKLNTSNATGNKETTFDDWMNGGGEW